MAHFDVGMHKRSGAARGCTSHERIIELTVVVPRAVAGLGSFGRVMRPPSLLLKKLSRALDEFATDIDNNAGL